MPDILPIMVATAFGCLVLAIVLAWPWLMEGSQQQGELPRREAKSIGPAPAEAVEPLADVAELDVEDERYLEWWTGCCR